MLLELMMLSTFTADVARAGQAALVVGDIMIEIALLGRPPTRPGTGTAVSPGTVRPTAAGRAREVGDSDRLATRRGDDDPPPGIQVPRSKGSELAGLSGGDHAEPGQLARR